jgi:hypothetical protein
VCENVSKTMKKRKINSALQPNSSYGFRVSFLFWGLEKNYAPFHAPESETQQSVLLGNK